MITRRNFRKAERGQVLILCAIFMVVLLLFVGLAIDFGMAYVTKAQLGKAADAAALTAARYSALGTASATNLATSAFAMNYNASSLDYNSNAAATTVVTPTPCPDPVKCPTLTGTLWSVTATASNPTIFAGLLPQYSTLSVASAAASLARTVEMTLILDISSSMIADGGKASLPGAVDDFITYFDDTHDSVALIEFGTTATKVLGMTTGSFQSTIINDANNIPWGGHTFSDAGLQWAFTEEMQPVVGNVQKVVVFFTDGGANMIQDNVTCNTGTVKSGYYNFGGEDPTPTVPVLPVTDYDFLTPAGGGVCSYSGTSNCCNGTFPSAKVAGSAAPAWSATGYSAWTGGTATTLTHDNVRDDALYRAVADATAMRQQTPPITVYAIGLGTAPDPVDPQFLCQVANDATCSTTYNPNLPAGQMEYAATATDLDAAFQAVASIIRLRLTQ